jgi:hypothetical protein
MAFNVCYSLITKKVSRGFLPWYHVTAWVLSLIVTVVPAAYDAMGYTGEFSRLREVRREAGREGGS